MHVLTFVMENGSASLCKYEDQSASFEDSVPLSFFEDNYDQDCWDEKLVLRIKNFRCIKDLKVELSPDSANVITGSNGIGKSTLIKSFQWLLLGGLRYLTKPTGYPIETTTVVSMLIPAHLTKSGKKMCVSRSARPGTLTIHQISPGKSCKIDHFMDSSKETFGNVQFYGRKRVREDAGRTEFPTKRMKGVLANGKQEVVEKGDNYMEGQPAQMFLLSELGITEDIYQAFINNHEGNTNSFMRISNERKHSLLAEINMSGYDLEGVKVLIKKYTRDLAEEKGSSLKAIEKYKKYQVSKELSCGYCSEPNVSSEDYKGKMKATKVRIKSLDSDKSKSIAEETSKKILWCKITEMDGKIKRAHDDLNSKVKDMSTLKVPSFGVSENILEEILQCENADVVQRMLYHPCLIRCSEAVGMTVEEFIVSDWEVLNRKCTVAKIAYERCSDMCRKREIAYEKETVEMYLKYCREVVDERKSNEINQLATNLHSSITSASWLEEFMGKSKELTLNMTTYKKEEELYASKIARLETLVADKKEEISNMKMTNSQNAISLKNVKLEISKLQCSLDGASQTLEEANKYITSGKSMYKDAVFGVAAYMVAVDIEECRDKVIAFVEKLRSDGECNLPSPSSCYDRDAWIPVLVAKTEEHGMRCKKDSADALVADLTKQLCAAKIKENELTQDCKSNHTSQYEANYSLMGLYSDLKSQEKLLSAVRGKISCADVRSKERENTIVSHTESMSSLNKLVLCSLAARGNNSKLCSGNQEVFSIQSAEEELNKLRKLHSLTAIEEKQCGEFMLQWGVREFISSADPMISESTNYEMMYLCSNRKEYNNYEGIAASVTPLDSLTALGLSVGFKTSKNIAQSIGRYSRDLDKLKKSQYEINLNIDQCRRQSNDLVKEWENSPEIRSSSSIADEIENLENVMEELANKKELASNLEMIKEEHDNLEKITEQSAVVGRLKVTLQEAEMKAMYSLVVEINKKMGLLVKRLMGEAYGFQLKTTKKEKKTEKAIVNVEVWKNGLYLGDPSVLSMGERAKLTTCFSLAICHILGLKFVIYDEVMAFMDSSSKEKVTQFIMEECKIMSIIVNHSELPGIESSICLDEMMY